ncbi:diguanylate cyclase with PAS/PAC and GAF sensors [Crinalium epipsammum PCC 9333]|uniref:Diguanylate cyclase with PAS/PAC and GAF sensors n=1 Tax=Crinalium epipsammum PCC 9333 TaxID=1173022 RepID=K9VYV0_9CYAN|nr:diguanylate cyclase [Crinalium epipsammum]AFZ12340.1 diguanylate cyclase with PAS/PAC and GAF sensors [Crinalium epipsammum PCC 9333]
MIEQDKTKDQLLAELATMRQLNNFLLFSGMGVQQHLEKLLIEEREFSATLLDTTSSLVNNFVVSVLDTPNTLVVVLDTQKRIVSFNHTCEVITHYSCNEVKGKQLWDIFVPPNQKDTVKALFTSLQSGEVVPEYECDWIIKDGSCRRISWSNKLLHNDDGEINYFLSIGVDVTERTLAQHELLVYKQNLEELVFKRTTELIKVNHKLKEEIAVRQQVEIELRQQYQREQLIGIIAQRILGCLSLDTILQTAVDEVRNFLNVERVTIYQIEPEKNGKFVVESVTPSISPIVGLHLHDPCFDRNYVLDYQNGRVSAINDIWTATLHPCYQNFLKRLGIRANLVVPLVANNKLWALLCAHQCSAPRYWQSWEINLLGALATQLAIAIQQAQLYQQLESANIKLQSLANLDGLTQLANRRYFNEYLNSEWNRLAREEAVLSLILCDIDFFKTYNDTYGHLAGDKCLIEVANAIRSATKRPADLVARYGGEEFAVILPNTDASGAMHLAELIRKIVKTLKISHLNSSEILGVTLSLGVASTIPNHQSEPVNLIRDADIALYQAKESGRDRTCSCLSFDTPRSQETMKATKC